MDGYQQMLIPPSERARRWALGMKIVLSIHIVVITGFFLSALYIDAVVDLLGALIGYMSIRNPRGYNFQQVLCYSIYLGMDSFWSVIRTVLFFLGLSRTQTPLVAWQYHIYVATITSSGVFYMFGSVVTWKLYRELRAIFARLMDEAPPIHVGQAAFVPQNGEPRYSVAPHPNPNPNLTVTQLGVNFS